MKRIINQSILGQLRRQSILPLLRHGMIVKAPTPFLNTTHFSTSRSSPVPLTSSSTLTSTVPDVSKVVQSGATVDHTDISCTIFDANGNITAVSKRFPKSKFLHENGLFPRDLRKIDASNVDVAPIIAVRSNCILVNMLYIKALVKKDSVLIFDSTNPIASSKLGLFMYDLESKLKTKIIHGTSNLNQAYEFRALESILINVMAVLETDIKQQSKICGSILTYLDNEIDREKLRDLLVNAKKLTTFYQKSLLIKNVLDELLDNDDDLENMYLTENSALRARLSEKEASGDLINTAENAELHTISSTSNTNVKTTTPKNKKTHITIFDNTELDTGEIEMLLEAYYKQCDEIVQQAETLMNDIKSTEEIVNIILDANRNSLMVYELKISIYTLGFTVATLIPAFYGMNLKNYIEQSEIAFGIVVGLSTLCGLSMIIYSFRKLRLVQKMNITNSSQISELDKKIKREAIWKIRNRDKKGVTDYITPTAGAFTDNRAPVASSRTSALMNETNGQKKWWKWNRRWFLWNMRWRWWNMHNQWGWSNKRARRMKTKSQRDLIWKWLVDDKNKPK
ncbi:hypothetical protein CANARDRAFT_30472 [[Candida] arabinofermentans NRRL YB-2248]|uniref:Magnesium transporter n=1 Tax=[Candida] arabinofermentans NRRL YB-2248 TaxID=983967 RepID=A0A1E4STR6_9ASCO|nr:hypothetical protein CANARDRAFT_30472 [[Candida] arabinofermentans NRRL YB-2248]